MAGHRALRQCMVLLGSLAPHYCKWGLPGGKGGGLWGYQGAIWLGQWCCRLVPVLLGVGVGQLGDAAWGWGAVARLFSAVREPQPRMGQCHWHSLLLLPAHARAGLAVPPPA